jgi:hypothetical protein
MERMLLVLVLARSLGVIDSFQWAGSVLLRGTTSALHRRHDLAMKSGGHGQGFKFLPLERGGRKFHFPRIVQIAGVYPELTAEDLLAPKSFPAAPVGRWVYDFSDPEGPQLGTVALPGSDVVAQCEDPVVMIATNTALGVQYPDEVEILVCVDRADRTLVSDGFFVFRTPDNRLLVQWSDELEPGYEILGRVALCAAPFIESMAKKVTGIAEEDEFEDD